MKTVFPAGRFDGRCLWHPDTDQWTVDENWNQIQGLDGCDATPQARHHWLTRMHPEDAALTTSTFTKLRVGQRNHEELELRIRHGEGHWIWVRLRLQVERDETDGRLGVHGVLQDISLRKRQEATLRQDDFFLGRAEPTSDVGGWQLNLADQQVTWSDETCRIHGRRPGYQPGFHEALNYFTPSARPVIRACIEQAKTSGEAYDIELPLNRADGKRIMVRCIGSVEYRDGEALRISGAVKDVTDTAERMLEQISHRHDELARLNERLSIATANGGIGIWELDFDTGQFVWDEHMFRFYGLYETSDRAIDARQWLAFVHRRDRRKLRDAASRARLGLVTDDIEFRIITADGAERQIHGTSRVIRDAAGRVVRLVGTNQDVTEARRLTYQLAHQHEILKVTLRSIGDAVITTDPDGVIVWMNPVAEQMVGWTNDDAQGQALAEVFNVIHGETRLAVPDPVHACLAENRLVRIADPTLLISKQGDECWIENKVAPIRSDAGDVYGAVLVFHDVTEQRSIASEMNWRATHDPLTGLVNRAEFEFILKRLHDAARDTDNVHALLFIDLDQFKIVNDSCGHSAGDRLLQKVSRLLEHTVRSDDVVARLGGDEFAVILEHCSAKRARTLAQQICDLMDAFRFAHEAQRFRIGASIGLVCFGGHWPDASVIIRAADTACYAAKEAGRNQVHLWSESDQSTGLRRIQTTWATRLATALDENGFTLYAQRIQTISSTSASAGNRGAPWHAEILLRLDTDSGEPVLPGAFLPAAERFNLISRIDEWVLNQVLAWLQNHPHETSVGTLWVNLSGQSIEDRRFQRATLSRLEAAGRSLCESLCFEITETAAVTNIVDAASFIRRLRSLGVRVALDDFGAGASSFGYLKKLPVDYLKIDGQFVRDLTEDPLNEAAVRCFTEVARIMGIQSVAEFVETSDVLKRLKSIGVDHVQGRLLHSPAPLADLLTRSDRKECVAAG